MVKKTRFRKKNSPRWKSYMGIRKNVLRFRPIARTTKRYRPTMARIRVPRATLAISVGVWCSCKIRYLQASQVVAEAVVNVDRDYELDDLIAFERKVNWRKGKPIASYFFQSTSLPGVVSCAKRWAKVLVQGDPSLIWDAPGVASTVPTPTAMNEQGEEIVYWVFQAQNRAEDIALVWAMGFEADRRTSLPPTRLCLG
jgi:hypothetical protein